MLIRAVRGIVGTAAAITLGLAAAAPAYAAEEASTELPLPTVTDVAVTAERVFLSGGAGSDHIVVTDPHGAITGGIDVAGATHLALSPNGRRLYVALPAAGAIAVYDTATLRERSSFPTGDGTCPDSLAVSGDRVWFGHGCEPGTGNIGVLDLGRRPARVRIDLLPTPTRVPPRLATAAGRDDLLVAATPEAVASYLIDRRGALAPLSSAGTGGGTAGVELAPDGATVYVVTTSNATARAYRPEDLTTVIRSYPTPMVFGNGVAVSPDGRYVAVASQMKYLAVGVFVEREPDATVVDTTYTPATLCGRLAWSPDGTRVYAVSQYAYGPPPHPAPVLHVLTPALP